MAAPNIVRVHAWRLAFNGQIHFTMFVQEIREGHRLSRRLLVPVICSHGYHAMLPCRKKYAKHGFCSSSNLRVPCNALGSMARLRLYFSLF